MASPQQTQFSEEQYLEAYPPGVEYNYWHAARNHILEKLIRGIGGKRVLDAGCGRGILVDHLVQRGLDCYGVDLAHVAVPRHLRERIFTGIGAELVPLPLRESIDTIIVADVIEHLPDPVGFLSSLPAGYPALRGLVIAVPARSELWSYRDEYYGHYRRYDLAELRKTAEGAGFSISRLQYMFRLPYLPARVLLSFKGDRRIEIGAPKAKMRGFHKALAYCLQADFELLPAGVYGTSCICSAVRGATRG